MAQDLLVPAIVRFNLGSNPVQVTGYSMKVLVVNGFRYEEATDAKGRRAYALRKGGEVVQDADVKVFVLKTPDGKFDDHIKKIEEALQATKNNDPKAYLHTVVVSFATSDGKAFGHVTFEGFVSEKTIDVDPDTALQQTAFDIEIYDPTTFEFKT